MTLENTLVTAGTAAAILVAGWLVLAVVKKRMPERLREIVTQVAPALALSVIVVAVLIILDPDRADELADGVMRYTPNALVAIIVVLVARAAGNIIGLFTEAALRQVSASIASRARLAITGTILGIGVIIALDQLGVSTDIIMLLVAAIAFGMALAIGLAIGLGSLPIARQVAAGRHVQERFEAGVRLQIIGHVGTLKATGLATSQLETDEGTIIEIPNEIFLSGAVTRLED